MQTVVYKQMTIVPDKVYEAGNSIGGSILKVLAYFDIFQYPLTQNEIKQFLDQPVSETAMENAIQRLLDEKIFSGSGIFILFKTIFYWQKKGYREISGL